MLQGESLLVNVGYLTVGGFKIGNLGQRAINNDRVDRGRTKLTCEIK